MSSPVYRSGAFLFSIACYGVFLLVFLYLLAFLANLLTFAFILILAVAGVQFVSRTLFQHSASLGVPMWTVYAAVPVGAAIEAWFMLFPRQEAGEQHKEAML